MSNRKRTPSGGIDRDALWDHLVPATDATPQAAEGIAHAADDTPSPRPTHEPTRGRGGRPRVDIERRRTSLLLSIEAWDLLDKIRYESRRKERRATTYTELIEKAIDLLAKERNISLDAER